jgi:hypothetical protein
MRIKFTDLLGRKYIKSLINSVILSILHHFTGISGVTYMSNKWANELDSTGIKGPALILLGLAISSIMINSIHLN